MWPEHLWTQSIGINSVFIEIKVVICCILFADDSNLHTSTPVKRSKYDDSVIAPPVESPVAGMAGDNR